MKKFIYAISALALIFTSCSSDSDSASEDSSNNSLVLLKKTTDSDGAIVNYTYNGNKIVSIVDNDTDESDEYYTYTGDLITQLEWKIDGNVEQRNTYEYNADGKLVAFKRFDLGMSWGNKEVYTYNADGTISFDHYVGDLTTQTQLNHSGKIFFTNGEITKIEEYDIHGVTHTTTYTYDSKNYALKNVLGFNKIAFVDGGGSPINHNLLSESFPGHPTINYSYLFESNDYPKSCTETDNDYVLTTQFFY